MLLYMYPPHSIWQVLRENCEVYEIDQSAQASSILEPQPTRCWSQGTRHPKPQRSDPRIPSDQPGEES